MKRSQTTIFLIIFTIALLSGCLAYAASQGFNVSFEVSSPVSVFVKWAAPEGRVGPAGTNWDTLYYLTVKDPGGVTVFTMPALTSTDVLGRDLYPIDLTGVGNGTYNIFIKGHQSLTLKMSNVTLAAGLNRLNFTQADNSTATGTVRLLAGDISGSTSSPAVMGDDVINAVDLDILLNRLDEDDFSTRGIRANLNQDVVVNSVDMSLMLDNLDKEGDQ
jgi:hypothetical protein